MRSGNLRLDTFAATTAQQGPSMLGAAFAHLGKIVEKATIPFVSSAGAGVGAVGRGQVVRKKIESISPFVALIPSVSVGEKLGRYVVKAFLDYVHTTDDGANALAADRKVMDFILTLAEVLKVTAESDKQKSDITRQASRLWDKYATEVKRLHDKENHVFSQIKGNVMSEQNSEIEAAANTIFKGVKKNLGTSSQGVMHSTSQLVNKKLGK